MGHAGAMGTPIDLLLRKGERLRYRWYQVKDLLALSKIGVSGATWDYYVRSWSKRDTTGLVWPGDEWGHESGWEDVYKEYFVPADAEKWEKAIEIGQGSGKYTLRVLEGSGVQIRAYDVSRAFLEVCETRCRSWIESDRLSLHQLKIEEPAQLYGETVQTGWERKVDAVFSINAMVHVDLQYLIVYLLTAALVLRPGGKIIFTFANAITDRGFWKLMRDIKETFPNQGKLRAASKFEWLSPEVIQNILPRLGFEIDYLGNTGPDDVEFKVLATLKDLEPGEALRGNLV